MGARTAAHPLHSRSCSSPAPAGLNHVSFHPGTSPLRISAHLRHLSEEPGDDAAVAQHGRHILPREDLDEHVGLVVLICRKVELRDRVQSEQDRAPTSALRFRAL